MSAEEQPPLSTSWPREVTPEEARALRARYLALAGDTRGPGADRDGDACDATVAAFVLPGDQ